MIEFEVDCRNPGEVLAACGLFLLADRRGSCQAWFDTDSRFRIAGAESAREVLTDLISQPVEVAEDDADAIVAGVPLNWWSREGRPFKLWAGKVRPGNLLPKLWEACAGLFDSINTDRSFLEVNMPLGSRLGADPRSSWRAIDIGFSPNEQGQQVSTYPFTELLAMIGLQAFLPFADRGKGYRYFLWQHPLPLLPARLCFSGASSTVPVQAYRFTISKSGSLKVLDFAELED